MTKCACGKNAERGTKCSKCRNFEMWEARKVRWEQWKRDNAQAIRQSTPAGDYSAMEK